VTDENDQALPGVNVLIKGTSQGTVTDANGEYSLNSVPSDAVVILSFIGYTPQEISVGGRTSVDVKLLPDSRTLEEVVVIGYGTTTQKELTGSVSVVNARHPVCRYLRHRVHPAVA
jgi:iron complex outermembrane receptor protein